MPENGHISIRNKDRVRWLIFNRPEKHNALSLDMVERALEAISRFDSDDSAHVLVISGGGNRAFVSGADISEFSRHEGAEEKFLKLCAGMFDAINDSPKPTIAMIQGYCFGGGVALAASCDLRYASEDASFCIPAAKLGIAYTVTSAKRMLDLIGAAATMEMLYTAGRYDSRQAERMGLVNGILPRTSLQEETGKVAQTIANNAPLSVRSSKFTIKHLLDSTGPEGELACERLIESCTGSEDFIEGRAAHAEKRKPQFKGR